MPLTSIKNMFCVMGIFVFWGMNCGNDVKIFDSDFVDQKTISRSYLIESNQEKCSEEKNFPAMYIKARFKSGDDAVSLVPPSQLLINGESVVPNRPFNGTRNNGRYSINGIIPGYTRNFECNLNEAVIEYTNHNGEKFTNKIDLRKIILKLPSNPVTQRNEELEVEYENSSNAEIYKVQIGVLDETNHRNLVDGFRVLTEETKKAVIYPEANKLIIPSIVWAKGKRGKNDLLIKVHARMPLGEGEKGNIEYIYPISADIELK